MSNSSTVLNELTQMKKVYKDQNFTFTKEQQSKYDELLELRRAFITYWKENGMVWVGPRVEKKKEDNNNP
jgi:flagellar motor component MotA|tara:strand:+ start:151 stop:360 length:210 start_codon:yes stop_codon:yes gene_type:complete